MKQNVETFSVNNTDFGWNLDESGKLTVTGTGKIPDCSCGHQPAAPWNDVKDSIFEIEILEGITEIGINAFRECKNLKSVKLPDTLSRIHAYAFWNCTQLLHIISKRTDFKYIYDKRAYEKEDTVIFGLESFYKVPWCNSRWGDFYCSDDTLYVCFSKNQDIIIPDHIRVLASFSLAYLHVNTVILPQELEIIKNLAFMEAVIEEEVCLGRSVKVIEPYAFLDAVILAANLPWKIHNEIQWERVPEDKGQIEKRNNRYVVELVQDKHLGEFRRIKIVEKKPIHHKDGTVTEVKNSKYVNVGKSIYRRMRNGKTVLCITCINDRVDSVKSFVWYKGYEVAEEYLMYPVLKDEGELDIWRDSLTYQESEEILSAFNCINGEKMKNEDRLRYVRPNVHEEWFCCKDRENYGGPLELALLEMWLKANPHITVDSSDDNREKDRSRWFVSV